MDSTDEQKTRMQCMRTRHFPRSWTKS